jgi:hypothetical protein
MSQPGARRVGDALSAEGIPVDAIRTQLATILASPDFRDSHRLARFLEFVVAQQLKGKASELKEYVVALEVFSREDSFDPRTDPLVRVYATRLRARLKRYYENEGSGDPILIQLPQRGYAPSFEVRRSSGESRDAIGEPGSPVRRKFILIAILLTILAVGWTGYLINSNKPSSDDPIMRRATHQTGSCAFPALSPDGKTLAYASDGGGSEDFNIWIQQLDGGDPVRLTHHPASDHSPDFSPDGMNIAFRSKRDGGGIYVMSVHGGREHRLVDRGYAPRYSPDGRWIAYHQGGELYVIPVAGGEALRLASEVQGAMQPTWTPDGKYILFTGRLEGGSNTWEWWTVPVDGGRAARSEAATMLARQNLRVNPNLSPPGGWYRNELIFSAQQGDAVNLWRIPFSPRNWQAAGPATRLTSGAGRETFARLSASGLVAFTAEIRATDIFTIPVDRNGFAKGEPVQRTHVALARGLPTPGFSLAGDASKLGFSMSSRGNSDIWVLDTNTGANTRIASSQWPEQQPALSGDGKWVAFSKVEQGVATVYMTPTIGGPARRICQQCGSPSGLSHSGDRLLLARASRLAIADTVQGQVQQLLDTGTEITGASFAPDDGWIGIATAGRILAVRVEGARTGTGKEFLQIVPASRGLLAFAWGPSGDVIYFIASLDDSRCVWGQRLNPVAKHPMGKPFEVRHFGTEQGSLWPDSDIAAGGDLLALRLARDQASIWTAQLK